MFLTHHTKDRFVIDEVLGIAKAVFKNTKALDFGKDTEIVSNLVGSTPKAVLHHIDVEKNRERIHNIRDELEEEEGRKEEKKPVPSDAPIEKLDYASQITLAFKAVEILGQILRNYYGSLKLPIKSEVLHESYTTPLRILHEFFDEFNRNAEAFVEAVKKMLEKKKTDIGQEKREDVARKVIFDIVGMITFGVIKKISSATGSENVKELSARVLGKDPSDAYRLIDISMKLDFPGNLPFDEIDGLVKRFKGNVFATRLLQSLVLAHLYMFETSDIDKQRLAASLGLEMKVQRGIDVRSKSTKLLHRGDEKS